MNKPDNLPWRALQLQMGWLHGFLIEDSDGKTRAMIADGPDAKADADAIVEAVNAYYLPPKGGHP